MSATAVGGGGGGGVCSGGTDQVDMWKIHMSIQRAFALLATHSYIYLPQDIRDGGGGRCRGKDVGRRLRELRGDMFALVASALRTPDPGFPPCSTAEDIEALIVRTGILSNPSRVVSEARDFLARKPSRRLKQAVEKHKQLDLIEAIYGILGGGGGSSRARVESLLRLYPSPYDLVAHAKASLVAVNSGSTSSAPVVKSTRRRHPKKKATSRRLRRTERRGEASSRLSHFEASCLVHMQSIFRKLPCHVSNRVKETVALMVAPDSTTGASFCIVQDGTSRGRQFGGIGGVHVIACRNKCTDDNAIASLEGAFEQSEGMQLTVLRRISLSAITTRVDAILHIKVADATVPGDSAAPPTLLNCDTQDGAEGEEEEEAEVLRQRVIIDITNNAAMPFRILHATVPMHTWEKLRSQARAARPSVPFGVDGWVHGNLTGPKELTDAIQVMIAPHWSPPTDTLGKSINRPPTNPHKEVNVPRAGLPGV